jgi:hypothetical protein
LVWFQVDDNLSFHRKTVEAGNSAMGLWVRAGAWSAATLTNGYIPARVATQIGTGTQIERLLNAGFWEPVSGGYQFHDWASKQQTKEQVEARRKWERERKAKQREQLRPTGTDVGLPPDASPPRALPSPSLPISTHLGEESPVASELAEPPPMFCPEHMPHGTAEPCHPCRRQRHARDNWMANQDVNIKRAVQAEARANAIARQAAIDACPFGCAENDGYRPNGTVCDHVDRTASNANGSAAVREALNETRARKANQ